MKKALQIIFILLSACDDKSPEPIEIVETASLDVKSFVDTLDYVAIAAHRGYHNDVPENSLQSIEAAVTLGIEFVELDVRSTKDGVLILMHDGTIDRTTSGSGGVANMTYANLDGIVLLTNTGHITSFSIPTLEQALNTAKGKIFVELDVKDADYQEVNRIIQKTQTGSQVLVLSDNTIFNSLPENFDFLLNSICEDQGDVDFFLNDNHTLALNLTKSVFTKVNTSSIERSGKASWRGILGGTDEKLLEGSYGLLDGVLTIKPSIIHTAYPEIVLEYLKENNYR